MKKILPLALAALGLTACSAGATPTPTPTPTPDKITLAGEMQVPVYLFKGSKGDTCDPSSGYSDIAGATVTITDDSGKIVASTVTAVVGVASDVRDYGGNGKVADCAFKFEASVPRSPFYGIEIGRRGKVTKQLADVDGKKVVLTLK